MVKVVYKGRASKLRHRGRSEDRNEYLFTRGIPTDVIDKTDAAFFKLKAKNNPETWEIVLPPKPKKEPDPEPPEEEPEVEEPVETEKKPPAKTPAKKGATK